MGRTLAYRYVPGNRIIGELPEAAPGSPLKKSFGLRAAQIRQLGVAESMTYLGYAFDPAP